MIDTTPTITEPVRHLMAMTDEVVSAKYIAPIVKMSESIIVHYAKTGQWDQDQLGKYVISGNRVKFFRKDFLQKCGFIDPEPEEPSAEKMLAQIWEALMDIRILLKAIVNDKKTASAATLTEKWGDSYE